jgi:hypothetical protein
LVSPSHSSPARRVEDRQIVVDARTGRLVAGDKRNGYGLSLEQGGRAVRKMIACQVVDVAQQPSCTQIRTQTSHDSAHIRQRSLAARIARHLR